VLELSRRSDVTTDVDRAISSAHCPSCGAPESATAAHACEFCGKVLNDGAHDWILTGIVGRGAAEAAIRAAHDQSAPSARPTSAGVLAWMVQMALVDGQIDRREMEAMSRVAQRSGVSNERLEAMIVAGRAGTMDLPAPADVREARDWLAWMTQSALADGSFTRQEYELLRRTGTRAGMSEYDVRMLVRKTRREMYDSGRAAIKQARLA
jgi:uncharacterized tellurite resistance protein B-like protein